MSYRVSALDISRAWPNIPAKDAEILECIANLLSTRIQSCPLYRHFGLPMQFVDKPINIAMPMAVVEVTEGLREFVPTDILQGLHFTHDESSPGKLIPIVEVDIDHEL